jgi:hypothetical protein
LKIKKNSDIAKKKEAMVKQCMWLGGLLAVSLCAVFPLSAQVPAEAASYNDGPYLFLEEGQWIARWVYEGQAYEDTVRAGSPLELPPEVSKSFDAAYLNFDTAYQLSPVTAFTAVEHLAVVSDVHGQYHTMVALLEAHCVIDEDTNWMFGNGHLVVLGDVFDRGDKVTDIFWLIYKLEKQAEQAGGKVHFLLGNHEVMVMQNDLRYVNRKYRFTMAAIRRSYHALYGEDTYLGRWLRSKPTVITINNIAFVHAGLSEPVLRLGLPLHEINTLFQEKIIGQSEESVMNDPVLALLYTEIGPIWYRGYFSVDFTREQAQRILRQLKVKHIVVGHTSNTKIVSIHRNRIIGVDSSIKLGGNNGELLLVSKGQFYGAGHDGSTYKLK